MDLHVSFFQVLITITTNEVNNNSTNTVIITALMTTAKAAAAWIATRTTTTRIVTSITTTKTEADPEITKTSTTEPEIPPPRTKARKIRTRIGRRGSRPNPRSGTKSGSRTLPEVPTPRSLHLRRRPNRPRNRPKRAAGRTTRSRAFSISRCRSSPVSWVKWSPRCCDNNNNNNNSNCNSSNANVTDPNLLLSESNQFQLCHFLQQTKAKEILQVTKKKHSSIIIVFVIKKTPKL